MPCLKGIKWEAGSWISASSRYVDCFFDLDELMGLTYEIFPEQPKKVALKMGVSTISHLPIKNPTIMKLENDIRELINKTLADCENNECKHISVAELIGLFSILSMDFYQQEFVE